MGDHRRPRVGPRLPPRAAGKMSSSVGFLSSGGDERDAAAVVFDGTPLWSGRAHSSGSRAVMLRRRSCRTPQQRGSRGLGSADVHPGRLRTARGPPAFRSRRRRSLALGGRSSAYQASPSGFKSDLESRGTTRTACSRLETTSPLPARAPLNLRPRPRVYACSVTNTTSPLHPGPAARPRAARRGELDDHRPLPARRAARDRQRDSKQGQSLEIARPSLWAPTARRGVLVVLVRGRTCDGARAAAGGRSENATKPPR